DRMEELVRTSFLIADDAIKDEILQSLREVAKDLAPADAKRLERFANILDLQRDRLGFIDSGVGSGVDEAQARMDELQARMDAAGETDDLTPEQIEELRRKMEEGERTIFLDQDGNVRMDYPASIAEHAKDRQHIRETIQE